jgi:4-diphosphocytidyl-2-C-methyl-D-erythritol kinase
VIELKSFAKINLGLEVVGKRKDGYHNLKTIFQTVDLFDTIEIEENSAGRLNLSGDDKTVAWGAGNTIARAFAAFFKHIPGVRQGFDVYVKKKIPPGSGLGGGSSNAAVILLFLNEYFKTGIQPETFIKIAAEIGADVPFFLVGGTVLGEGIGEKMTFLRDLAETFAGIVVPPINVSTGLIFSNLNLTSRPIKSKIHSFMKSRDFSILENNLEKITFKLFPNVRLIKEKMMNSMSCDIALMSGSGSAVYCLAGKQDIDRLKNLFPECATFAVSTLNKQNYINSIGASPSGKAPVFGAGIRRFESCRPSE